MTDASQWWTIVRRSFGVPDVVGDEVAHARIASLLVPDPAVDFQGDLEARNRWVRTVADEVTRFGEKGLLDPLLVAEAEAGEVAEAVAAALSHERSASAGDPPEVTAARYLLEMLHGFMERHPFDATAAHIAEPLPGA